jgi:hypothetical protein
MEDEDLDDSEQEQVEEGEAEEESPSQSPVRDDAPGSASQNQGSPLQKNNNNVTSSPISDKKPSI